VNLTPQSDAKLTPPEQRDLIERRRGAVEDFLKQLKPPSDPFDYFKGHIEANTNQIPKPAAPTA
jgi:hypothetical protein